MSDFVDPMRAKVGNLVLLPMVPLYGAKVGGSGLYIPFVVMEASHDFLLVTPYATPTEQSIRLHRRNFGSTVIESETIIREEKMRGEYRISKRHREPINFEEPTPTQEPSK